jgi:hypothetical protein
MRRRVLVEVQYLCGSADSVTFRLPLQNVLSLSSNGVLISVEIHSDAYRVDCHDEGARYAVLQQVSIGQGSSLVVLPMGSLCPVTERAR